MSMLNFNFPTFFCIYRMTAAMILSGFWSRYWINELEENYFCY